MHITPAAVKYLVGQEKRAFGLTTVHSGLALDTACMVEVHAL